MFADPPFTFSRSRLPGSYAHFWWLHAVFVFPVATTPCVHSCSLPNPSFFAQGQISSLGPSGFHLLKLINYVTQAGDNPLTKVASTYLEAFVGNNNRDDQCSCSCYNFHTLQSAKVCGTHTLLHDYTCLLHMITNLATTYLLQQRNQK